MKKKALLLALPVLMALSGCSGVNVSPRTDLMAEDNLAHEEIFGAVEEAGELGLKKVGPRKLAALTSSDVKIGYQINFNAGGAGTADDTISIRFVAAIKNAGVTAFWHRGLSKQDSTEGADPSGTGWKYKFSDYKNDTSGKESTKMYASLTADGGTITAGVTEGYEEYAGFVIYTLRNIPYVEYIDSYLAAYVIVAEDGNSSNMVKSQALAVKIEKNDLGTASKNKFYFNPDLTDTHFLEGTINGVLRDGSDNSTHSLIVADEDAGDGYDARYANVELKTADSFGSFYYNKYANFQFFGKTSYFGDSSELLTSSASLSEYNAPKANGTYTLFVNKGGLANHITTYKVGADQVYTLTDMPNWIVPNCTLFLGYADAGDNWVWSSTAISVDGSTGTFTLPNNILRFLLARCYTGTTTPDWDNHGDSLGRIYNKTCDFNVAMGYFTFGCGESVWSNY